jgi:uroporphyrinogen decarboxylase
MEIKVQRIKNANKYPGDRYTPRERVLKILDHEEPDRVTAELGGCMSFMTKQVYFKVKHYLGLPLKFDEIDYWPREASYSPFWAPRIDEEIYRRFKIDFRAVGIKLAGPFVSKKVYPDGSFIDEWGYHRKAGETYMEFATPYALEHAQTLDEIEDDPYWPDPETERSVEGLGRLARALDDAGYAVCCLNPGSGGVFETAFSRRGFDKFMEDMYFRPKLAHALLNKATQLQITMYDMLLDEVGDYCVIVGTADDLAGQITPFLSLEKYRTFIKPYQKRLYDFIHSKTHARLYLHSCGNIEMFVNDLIEIGVDILNPVQPECPDMDLKVLKQKYGDRLTFCGGIGSQHILSHGSRAEVEAEVKRAISAAAVGGGYIVAPGHYIQPEVSPENVCAMYDAVIEHGQYPIKP